MKSYILTGLLWGDEGKGSICGALSKRHKSPLVIRHNGGPQAAHNVITDEGVHHTFSQFGSGTFEGAKTLLSRYMLINPLNMLKEANVLVEKGINDPFNSVYVSKRALIITPFHQVLNRLKEIARGNNRHGSCGQGVAVAFNYALEHPFEAIHISDLDSNNLKSKLDNLKKYIKKEVDKLLLKSDSEIVTKELAALNFELNDLIEVYRDFHGLINVLDENQISELINKTDITIFEGAQGVHLDQTFGQFPFVTRSTTTSSNALRILKEAAYQGEVERIGLLRTYATRHGHGPFPTENKELTPLIDNDHNKANDWQGNFRVGYLDIPALKYALRISPVDSLAISHLDSLRMAENWKICIDYKNEDGTVLDLNKPVFTNTEIQEQITNKLFKVKCVYQNVPSHSVLTFIEKSLKTPIRIMSYGQQAKDKLWIDV